MDGFLRICRHCKTAFSDGFPRVNCLCGKNDAEPEPTPQPTPAGDRYPSDPYGYDMASSTAPDADRANWQDAAFDDVPVWWI